MNKDLHDKLKQFEQEENCTIVYVTQYGSKLYGTNNPKSDTDYKGIYIPDKRDVLLKRDLEHWTSNTNNTKEKNGAEDTDLQLFSIYKFFDLLMKGETGALDILFSMWATDTVEFEETWFTDYIKDNYAELLNKNMKAFIGYCVGQSKKYGVKGARYNELDYFVKFLKGIRLQSGFPAELGETYSENKLSTIFPFFEQYLDKENPKYIRFIMAKGPRGDKGKQDEIPYIEVLGKKFCGDVTCGYFEEKIIEQYDQFGNRTKASAEGVDWKAMSHAVRVIIECEELLDTNFIKFPLQEFEYIKRIKEGKEDVEDVLDFIDRKLDIVNEKLAESELPERSNRDFMDETVLEFLERLYLNHHGSVDAVL